ncbi:MAG: hypothetical protein ABI438_09770 [Dermatophilaceae bacterium]
MSAARSALVGACALLLLAGCTGAPKPATAGTPATTETQSTAALPATTESASVLALRRAVKSYGQALAGRSPAAVREGLHLTAPNSVAYRYLQHMANTTDPALLAGTPDPKLTPMPVGDDAFKFCTIPDNEFSCSTYRFTVNQDGKLVDFTINKQPVGPHFTVVSGQPITLGGVRFTLLTAYETMAGGHLVLSLKVESGAEAITTSPQTWTYRSPDGRPVPVWGASGPTYVVARSSVIVWMSFESAKSGGSITVNGCPSQECPGGSFSGVLKVG